MISKIFCLEEKPLFKKIKEGGTSKCLERTFIIALFASPLTGGSLTEITKWKLSIFFISSLRDPGFAVTKTFTRFIVTCSCN